jgi:DNA-directed RNA polymerase subunit N (RpoN/RPB10)
MIIRSLCTAVVNNIWVPLFLPELNEIDFPKVVHLTLGNPCFAKYHCRRLLIMYTSYINHCIRNVESL